MNANTQLPAAKHGAKALVQTLFDKGDLPRPTRKTPQPRALNRDGRGSVMRASRTQELSTDLALYAQPGKVRLESLDSYDWRKQLADFLRAYGRMRSNNFEKPTSEETLRNRRDILYSTFEDLMKEKSLKTLSQIRPRHLPAMFELWNKRNISKRAQINYYNNVRWFWRICGIEIEPIAHFAKEKGEFTINRNSVKDKSWSGNGVDFEGIYQKVLIDDPIAARILLSMKTYGLRIKEALCLRPHESDFGDRLQVLRGSKTGRSRQLVFEDFEDDGFRAVLDDLKTQVSEDAHLAWSHRTLKQAKRHMYHICERYGITKDQLGVSPHGLRHEFSINQLETLTGQKAPVRGGIVLNYRTLISASRKVSRAMGHNRPKVTGAYYGSFISLERDQLREFERAWARIEYVMNEVGTYLEKMEIDNLYWIGALAKGEKGSPTYEFALPPNVGALTCIQVAAHISELILSATGLDARIVAWESMAPTMQTRWQEDSIPMFKAVGPLEYMHGRLEAMKAARLSDAQPAAPMATEREEDK